MIRVGILCHFVVHLFDLTYFLVFNVLKWSDSNSEKFPNVPPAFFEKKGLTGVNDVKVRTKK